MSHAISQLKRPLLAEARDYCARHGVESLDEMEKVRLSLCVREFREQMRPLQEILAKVHPSTYSINPREPLPATYLALQAQVEEIARNTAAKLGLTYPTR